MAVAGGGISSDCCEVSDEERVGREEVRTGVLSTIVSFSFDRNFRAVSGVDGMVDMIDKGGEWCRAEESESA